MKDKIDLIFSDLKNEVITEKQAHQQVLYLFAVMPSLPIERCDVEEFLITKGICNHPHIQDSLTGKNDYEVADLIAEYANSFFRQ